MRFRVPRSVLVFIVALFLLILQPVASTAEEGKAVKLEFVPYYELTPEDAIEQCYANLEQLGIDTSLITITKLESVKGKLLAVQSTQDLIDIVKQIMQNIDPPPPPPPPPVVVMEILETITIHNLSPAELGYKLDEVMVTFMNFTRLEPSGENFFIYARDEEGTNSINFYIPNIDEVNKMFFERRQGYVGYQVYIRATDREKTFIEQIKSILTTVDMPLAGKEYKAIQIYYVEVAETINSLKALGYHAINTSTEAGDIDDAISKGASPVIYSAPSVKTQSVRLSTSFGSGSSKDIRAGQFTTLSMQDPVATSDIHRLIVYGSPEEISAVEEFIKLIDVPARQIMIEAHIIEINVDSLKDLGLKEVQGVDDLFRGSLSSLFPGEGAVAADANMFIYDDDGQPAGSFSAAIQILVQDGNATIKARPKVVTVDGRQAIISIGRQVPVVTETRLSNDRSVFEINFVPVGITLNIKPRIGAGGREIQMQVDAVVSNVETINNVIADASLRAPELNTREVHTIVRIPNHQSLILGGLISTETERRTYRVPLLGDLPLIGSFFRRTKTGETRTEIIIVITPHIAEELEPRSYEDEENPFLVDDVAFTPIGTDILDEIANILLPSTYIIKQTDIEGMDLSTLEPLVARADIEKNSTDDPVLLTLRNIIRKLNLVKSLRMMDAPVPDWLDPDMVYYNAEAFLIIYMQEMNGLTIDELIPGRQIVIPSNPKPQEGFESSTPLWNSINFMHLTQRYDPMQNVVRTLMLLDGKQPPERKELPETEPVPPGAFGAGAEERDSDMIGYGPYKIGLESSEGTHKLVEVSFELLPKEDADKALIESRRDDIEALALAILSDYTFEELTSPAGSGSAAGGLAAGIEELLGDEVVEEINLYQTAS